MKGLADRYSFLEEENEKFEQNYALLDRTLGQYRQRIAELEQTAQ